MFAPVHLDPKPNHKSCDLLQDLKFITIQLEIVDQYLQKNITIKYAFYCINAHNIYLFSSVKCRKHASYSLPCLRQLLLDSGNITLS